MPTIPPRFRALRNFARGATAVIVIGSLGAIGYGIFAWAVLNDPRGVGWLSGGLAVLALGLLLFTHFSLTHKAASNAYRSYDALLDIVEQMRRQSDMLRTIADNSSLSEWAKRIVYREKDYEYLRDTIEGASARQDWVSAERLIRELDEEFGMRDEAAKLRAELEQARRATAEEKVAAALERVDSLCESHKWEQALRESERLLSLFPGEPRIAALTREVDLRRQQCKRTLLKDYDQAVRNHDVNTAHRLLFELDHYLAPNEAAALKESARGVFRAKLQQMGVQFSLAVTDHQFRKAVAIGERLGREFPNSRYAQEIATMMPALRQRAEQDTPARES
ncbi:MAG: hypothetical protein PVJ57_15975 [Phycisphaerae bacterium]|jgi:hypothetical protein